MKAIVTLLLYCFCLISFSQNKTNFEAANALYNDGNYAEAINKYETILATKVHSAALYFNLANANYKLNNIAPSIYYYEKALQLSPNDKAITNNLAFAQNMTVDAIEKVPEVGFTKILKTIVNKANTDTWALFAIVGVLVFVALFLVYHFTYKTAIKRIAFITSVLCLFLGCVSVVMAFQKENLDKKDNPAIVFAQESKVKLDPKVASEELFRLHEGTKIQILETYDNWCKIKSSDNATGWVPLKDVKLLNVF